MRILIIGTTVFPCGFGKYAGIEKLTWDFCDELAKQGHKVILAAPIGSEPPKGVELIETVNCEYQQDRDDIAYYNYCHLLKDVDVIHDFSHGHIVARWEKDKNLPIISMLWDNVTRKYEKAPYNIVALSYWQARRFAQMYNQTVRVENLCVDTERYGFNPNKEDFYLFVGKLTPEKGALQAIEMARELGVKLVVCGGKLRTDPPNYLYRVMEQHDGKQIIFYGNVVDHVKIRLMQKAKALIYPVMQPEAHWQTGVEALSCGTPIIAFRLGAFQELFGNPKIGFLVRNKQEFLEAMKRIDEINPEDCRHYAVEKFDKKKVVSDYIKLYKEVAEGLRW